MKPVQFHRFVQVPVLKRLDLDSPSARILMLGTALYESQGLTYIDQVTGTGGPLKDDRLGPAVSPYQIEPATHTDLWRNFLADRRCDRLRLAVLDMQATWPSIEQQLAANLYYATAIARLIFYRARPPLPAADDLDGLALYYKVHFNTFAGKATPDAFKAAWRVYGGAEIVAACA